MMRRSFLALTGVSAAVGWKGAEAGVQVGRPPSDPARLAARNRDRSAVIAQHGMVCASQPLAALVGIDVLKAGGSCGRRGHRHERRARPDGAGELRHRRRSVRDRLEREGPQALRPERERPRARGLDAREGEKPRPPAHPAPEPAVLERARLRQRLAGVERALRPSRPRPRCSGPRSSTRARASPSRRSSPRTSAPGAARNTRSSPPVFHPGGRAPGYGDVFQNPLLAASYERIAKDGAAGFYAGRDRRADRGPVARARRPHEPRGPPLAPRRLGRPRLLELPRLRRLGDSRRTARASRRSRS